MKSSNRIRQPIRRALILLAFILFPLTINYFSPYLIIDGAAQGILSGSAITFALMFLGSLFLGRAWCGWACPAAGLQEACAMVNGRKVNNRRNWIKWVIWLPWLAGIIALFVAAGGVQQVDVLHKTEKVISVAEPMNWIIYYSVVTLIAGVSLAVGNRAFCHYVCWMAPFMILGRRMRNALRLPALRLQVQPEQCVDCKQCVRHCPMSLDVNGMVQLGSMENSECILCGNCVDVCAQKVIAYRFDNQL